MKCLLTIVLAVLLALPALHCTSQAITDYHPLGWEAYSQNLTNVFCGFHNQAALANLEKFSAGFFVLQRFSIKELRQYQFAIALPTSSGNFNLTGTLSGYEKFHRQQLGIAYSRKLTNWMDIGIQIDYLNMRIPAYGSAHAFTFALATLFHINQKWHAGVQVYNPVKASYQKLGNDQVPDIYQIGIGYQPSKIFQIAAEVSRVKKENVFAIAFYYRIAKALSLSGGTNTRLYPLFGGITLHLNSIDLILSASFHQELGLTPGAGVIFNSSESHEH